MGEKQNYMDNKNIHFKHLSNKFEDTALHKS